MPVLTSSSRPSPAPSRSGAARRQNAVEFAIARSTIDDYIDKVFSKEGLMRGRDLSEGNLLSHIWALAWPVMLSMFFQTLYNATDAYWVSKLSADAVAAVSISQITLFVMISLSMGITVGSGVLMAMAIGRKDIVEAERILGQSFVLSAMAGAAFTALCLAFRHSLLAASGATG